MNKIFTIGFFGILILMVTGIVYVSFYQKPPVRQLVETTIPSSQFK